MLVSYLFWFIVSTLLSNEVNGSHFLSHLCTNTRIGTYAYPGVNNVYFECEYGNATIYACPSDTNFDPIFTKCSEKEVPYDRSFCSNHDLYLPHPFDCTKFIMCLNSEIKIINCKTSMVYSIDTNRCEYKSRVSACKSRLAKNKLRTDLNTHIHFNANEIIGRKRDILHELTNFDKEADEDIDKNSEELNGSSLQSSHELDKVIIENKIPDDVLFSSEQDPSNQTTINFSDMIPRRSKKKDTKIDTNDELSIEKMNILLILLGAPFNVSIKKKQANSTVDNQALAESFKNVIENFFLNYNINKGKKTSTENINLPLQTNISRLNFNVSEDISSNLITDSNEARHFPDNVEVITQSMEILSSTSSSLGEPEEEETGSSTISEEIQNTIVSSNKMDTSTLASSVTNTVLDEIENTVVSTTPMIEINDNMTVLEQHSDTFSLSSAPFISTSERAESTLRYSENDEATDRVDSVISQRMNTYFPSTTSNSVSEISNIDISSTVDERVEETSSEEPTLLDSDLDIIDKVASGIENVKEVENITANDSVLTKVKDIIVPVLMTEISTSAFGSGETLSTNPTVNFNSEKMENTTISSQHEEKFLSSSVTSRSLGSEIDISKNLESDSDNISEVTEFNNLNHMKVEEVTELGKSLESPTPVLIKFNTESTKLEEVDEISENTQSTPVSTQHVEVTSSTIAVDEISAKVKTSTDGSTLQENVSEEEIFSSLLPTPNSILKVTEAEANDTEDVTNQSLAPFSEQTINIPIVETSNANVTATTEFESTIHSVPLEITSTVIKNHENNETLVVVGDIAVTTESQKRDSTYLKPKYINMTENHKNDKTLVITEDIAATIKSQVDSTSTTPEYISTTHSQKNDELSAMPEHASSFVESLINEETSSTLPDDNLSVNKNNIPNQEIPDEPKIQNETAVSLLDVDSDITQNAANDKIRPSRSVESTNFTETTNIPLVYAWHNARNIRTVSVPKQRLRLNGRAQANYGYVEVKGIDDTWRGVCQSTDWTIAEANVICQELGYQNGAQKAWKGQTNQVEIPVWTATSSIQCHGDEDWVNRCRFQDETECDLQRNAVGVECILSGATSD